MQEIVVRSLGSLEKEFQPNELAYLALTTKIELPLRDRWAFSLYRELGDSLIVSREWKRTDLAILRGQSPQVLIELKAMYSFDAALDRGGISGYTDAMSRDAKKARILAETTTEIYTVLLATHPVGTVSTEMNGAIKYIPGINKAVKRFGSAVKVRSIAREAVNNKLRDRNLIMCGSLTRGRAFNLEVFIDYWVVKA